MYKLDLHTHSFISPDGSLRAADYKLALTSGMLDFIAITDHNEISFARSLHDELGDQIIVGEEIMTSEGEIIGLYLSDRIPSNLSPEETIAKIREQNGLVYIPHPFESAHRSGIPENVLNRISNDIDIVEIYNGRAFLQRKAKRAQEWARDHRMPGTASSDSHGRAGWGKTYSSISVQPAPETLPLLIASARLSKNRVGLRGSLYPTLNRIRKHSAL